MVKETTITVGPTSIDDYNNLWVAPTDGSSKIKIGEKRSHLHELFQMGNIVQLTWDSYKNKDYVANAEIVTGTTEPTVVKEAKKMGAEVINSKDASIARAVAFKGAIDLATSGLIEVKAIGVYSKRYAPWLETGE